MIYDCAEDDLVPTVEAALEVVKPDRILVVVVWDGSAVSSAVRALARSLGRRPVADFRLVTRSGQVIEVMSTHARPERLSFKRIDAAVITTTFRGALLEELEFRVRVAVLDRLAEAEAVDDWADELTPELRSAY